LDRGGGGKEGGYFDRGERGERHVEGGRERREAWTARDRAASADKGEWRNRGKSKRGWMDR